MNCKPPNSGTILRHERLGHNGRGQTDAAGEIPSPPAPDLASDRMRRLPSGTQYSLPGDWINRRGSPQAAEPIKRIVVIKPDHIGDLLIAADAFFLLRRFFPHARIDLICGPWNVALARRLGVFDDVHGVQFFDEISGRQSDRGVARENRRKGSATLRELNLDPYDIAIDLRYDLDARTILLGLNARVYAGWGNIKEFPFLDVALPIDHNAPDADRQDRRLLTARNFHRSVRDHLTPSPQVFQKVTPTQPAVRIEFSVLHSAQSLNHGASVEVPPAAITLDDLTLILESSQHRANETSRKISPGDPDLIPASGWDVLADGALRVSGKQSILWILLPTACHEPDVRIRFNLSCHGSSMNAPACLIRWGAADHAKEISFTDVTRKVSVDIAVSRRENVARFVSDPFVLAPGNYAAVFQIKVPQEIQAGMLLRLVVRGIESDSVIFRDCVDSRVLRTGTCDIDFCFAVETARDRLVMVAEFENTDGFDGTLIAWASIERVERFRLNIPTGHMEDRATLLIFRVAQMFSKEASFSSDRLEGLLSSRRSAYLGRESKAAEAIRERIVTWKTSGDCVIGVGLGCNTRIRKWPLSYFIELAKHLLSMERVRIVFIGGPDDRHEATSACRGLGLDETLHSSCGLVPLEDLGRVLQPLDLFIGNNTGPTHFAGKVGVRTIGIYAGTNHPREWGPIGQRASWIYRDEPCAPCHLTDLDQCQYGHACMLDLTVTDVLFVVEPEVRAIIRQRCRGDHEWPDKALCPYETAPCERSTSTPNSDGHDREDHVGPDR